MVYFFLFLFGLSIGSFLSCWVYRINNATRQQCNKVTMRRSVCDHCGKQLAWYDNLPLISFLFLRGKSRCCHSPIPFQYFLVELSTALLTLAVYHILIYDISIYHIWSFGLSLLIIYALIAIFISDLNYQTVPDVIVWPGIAMALIYDLLISVHLEGVHSATFQVSFAQYLFSGLGAGSLFFLFSKVKIKNQQAMGFGDVEIAILMGLFLGFPKILVAFYLAFLTGAFFGVILILGGKKNLKSQIAFGPFLVGGTIFAFFFGEQIIKIFLLSS